MGRPPRQPRQSAAGPRGYEDCLVTFIDVLGFREIVETRDPADVHDLLEHMRRTNESDDVPTNRIQEVRVQPRLFTRQISDAVVRVVTIDTQFYNGALFWELWLLALVQTDLIQRGFLIRGGMAMGELNIGYNGDGQLFGPAFNRAYQIETEEAIFPRIVVDDEIVTAVQHDERLGSEHHTREEDFERVNNLLGTGEDDTRFIDYLRTVQPDSNVDIVAVLRAERDLVRARRHAGMNHRIARKYNWLTNYHNGFIREFSDTDDRLTEIDWHDLIL